MGESCLLIFTLTVFLGYGFGFVEEDHQHDELAVKRDAVKLAFEKTGIVPDVIDEPPLKILRVKWETVEANFGNVLTPREVAKQPDVHWENSFEKFYCLIMVDPDELNRKDHTEREFLHWLVVNIPGENVDEGEVLAEYVGSGPPQDGGLHRYILLKYEQPKKLVFDERRLKFPSATGFKDRVKFSSRAFAKKYKFRPTHTANFYFARWDDSVPALLKNLGG